MSMVLPFPQTKKALRLYHSGMDAAGFLSLIMMEQAGETPPTNVCRLDGLEQDLPERSPELLLALMLWEQLPAPNRDSIRRAVRGMAYGDKPDPCAVRLNNALRLR